MNTEINTNFNVSHWNESSYSPVTGNTEMGNLNDRINAKMTREFKI